MSTKDEISRDRPYARIIQVPFADGDRLVEILKSIPRDDTITLIRRDQAMNRCRVHAKVKKQDLLTIKLTFKDVTVTRPPDAKKAHMLLDMETNNPCYEIVLPIIKNRATRFR